jgi:addiction module HigA family antidote
VTAVHPGEHLFEELEALDMSAAELARKINVPTNRITQILSGTRAITGDTALCLAHFFGTSAQHWLNLQSLLRAVPRPREGRKIHQGTSHA